MSQWKLNDLAVHSGQRDIVYSIDRGGLLGKLAKVCPFHIN